jgi:16S rRNA (cytidine1402-2'-O)-methyltransferase
MPEISQKSNQNIEYGKLYLIPSPLGQNENLDLIIPSGVQQIIKTINYLFVEEIRTARRYLKKIDKTIIIDEIHFTEYNEHSVKTDVLQYIQPLLEGHHAGIISEAGLPCIADPGREIVSLAQQHGITVVPLTGPGSIFLALMASGFNGQNFSFHGYLPVDKNQLQLKIKQLEQTAEKLDQTQIFIETPYRNQQLITSLISICKAETKLCVASDLTLPTEQIVVRTIREWKQIRPDFHKRPCVFLLY